MPEAVQQRLLTALRNCNTLPNVLCLPELVFGGLVWILMASKPVGIGDMLAADNHSLGWAMFASVFCFVMTIVWLLIFARGAFKKSSRWAAADFFFHLLAFILYLSASGVLTNETFVRDWKHIVNALGKAGENIVNMANPAGAVKTVKNLGENILKNPKGNIVDTVGQTILGNLNPQNLYNIDIAATVFSFISTLLYLIHCILSAKRWKTL